jgi:hypothetical protein
MAGCCESNRLEKWDTENRNAQRRFFNTHVKPVLSKGQRLFVIVSDGFRYECGEEYLRLMEKEKRFESSIEYAFTSLPSYTQLGMAVLLPNKNLEISTGNDDVKVDGISASGLAGRKKILKSIEEFKATAINAEDFMKMKAAVNGILTKNFTIP